MRRTGLLLAGALLATGVGFAVSAPASAAPASGGSNAVVAYPGDWYWDNGNDCWYGIYGGYNYYRPWYGVGNPWGIYGGSYGGLWGVGVGVGIY
ncbi:hypothetical protein ACIBSW_00300 [Actinoplanes sp. NPDC049668]|uniref:hypothetical protein n=1 Tax=unclassified Actinoplanes TaxID=2626549 RepID=UPI0033A70070